MLLERGTPLGSLDNKMFHFFTQLLNFLSFLDQLGVMTEVPNIDSYSDAQSYLSNLQFETVIQELAIDFIQIEDPLCSKERIVLDVSIKNNIRLIFQASWYR